MGSSVVAERYHINGSRGTKMLLIDVCDCMQTVVMLLWCCCFGGGEVVVKVSGGACPPAHQEGL